MTITETPIPGAYRLQRAPSHDPRGSFARLLDLVELQQAGLPAAFVQVNLSQNHRRGTLRGLHAQTGPAAEDKLVACLRGAVFDVCVDLRPGSPTFGRYVGEELSEENGAALYVPKGCAHGYLSLTHNSQVLYFVTQVYTPGAEQGYRYNDPAFGIPWPFPGPYILSDKDAAWPLLEIPREIPREIKTERKGQQP
jgi:dTDP-4-dehydrorhamnose 3,5-epimerase